MSWPSGLPILPYLLITLCYLIPWADSQGPTCPPPPGIANGRVRHSGPYYHDDEVVYDCDDGYGITGNGRSRCNTTTTPRYSAAPECIPPNPIDNRREVNNYYEGIPDWLAILGAVLLGLLFLLLLGCLAAAMWYMCCRGGSCFGMAGSNTSSMTSSSHMYNKTSTSTSNHVTPPKSVPTQDAGTQVSIRQSGGDYGDYPQKHNATYTKVEYTKQILGEAPPTTPAKEPMWMPHAKPPRNDVYHVKSITK